MDIKTKMIGVVLVVLGFLYLLNPPPTKGQEWNNPQDIARAERQLEQAKRILAGEPRLAPVPIPSVVERPKPTGRVATSKWRLAKMFDEGKLVYKLTPHQIALIRAVETDHGLNKIVGDDGESFGDLQIQQNYVDDVNKFCGTDILATDCHHDLELSILVTQAYMNRYATVKYLGREPTFEDMARIHNGGPMGWNSRFKVYPDTTRYWEKIKERWHQVTADKVRQVNIAP